MNHLNNKSILITGATGTFGTNCLKRIIKNVKPKRLVIFSRDEQKQFQMSKIFSTEKYPFLRYMLGDIRDKNRLKKAFSEIDLVIHAAAMKHVPAAEYNPTECIATNIIGAQNIIDIAIENEVKNVLALSTDKAANPINLYGATKLCSDKLFVAANNLSGKQKTRFSIVRYGNVIGSRGSVLEYYKKLLSQGEKKLPLTHKDMTRFFITVDSGVDFVLSCIKFMNGGEIFVPKLKSIKIKNLIEYLVGKDNFNIIGMRPGEKLHEIMIPYEESINCIDMKKYFIIQPMFTWWNTKKLKYNLLSKGKPVPKNFVYSSENKDLIMDNKQLRMILKEFLN